MHYAIYNCKSPDGILIMLQGSERHATLYAIKKPWEIQSPTKEVNEDPTGRVYNVDAKELLNLTNFDIIHLL